MRSASHATGNRGKLLRRLAVAMIAAAPSSCGGFRSVAGVAGRAFAARRSSSTAVGMGASAYPSVHDKNLVSIGNCLEAWSASKAHANDDGSGSGLVFVDGSWYHRGGRNGRAEFEGGPRIPNSKYVDMDDIAAKGPELNPKDLPRMLPPKELFAAAMDSFGIANSDHVVVYGRDGCVFTPRTFFLFRSMGHDPSRVHLMQGSFEEWVEAGGEVETGPAAVVRAEDLDLCAPTAYQARDASNVCDMDRVLRAIRASDGGGGDDDDGAVILDPRGTSFTKGHMPGAVHVPYHSIVASDDTLKFRPREELLGVFEAAGVDVRTDRQIICTCGSGVSVCHLFLALEECGRDSRNTVIYDGSWAEWGADESTPKVVEGGL